VDEAESYSLRNSPVVAEVTLVLMDNTVDEAESYSLRNSPVVTVVLLALMDSTVDEVVSKRNKLW
jgi:hypothetical protein